MRSQEHILLLNTLTSLESIMKERLLTSPFEAQEMRSHLTYVIEREKKTNTTREKLEIKYHAAVKAKESEVKF